jgi:Flp pilus assembly protein TadG
MVDGFNLFLAAWFFVVFPLFLLAGLFAVKRAVRDAADALSRTAESQESIASIEESRGAPPN